MSSRRDQIAIDEEAKYPDERVSSRRDKDDEKQTAQSLKRDSKRGSPADLVEQLQSKFESTDYSAATGETPIQRLEHMSKDVNAIVVEREKIAREKEAAEDAVWWKQEHERQHATGGHETAAQQKLKGGPGDRMTDAAPNKTVTTQRGIEREIKSPRDAFASNARVSRADMPQGSATAAAGGNASGWLSGPKDDKLDYVRAHEGGATKDARIGWGSSDKGEVRDHLRTSRRVGEEPLSSEFPALSKGVQIAGSGHHDLTEEKASLDKTRAKRRQLWDGYEPLRTDPDNLPTRQKDGQFRMALTDTLPHGPIVRTKQSASSAFGPIASGMEDSDPTRTHTRPGRNRIVEMGKDEALLTQQDFERNVPPTGRMQGGVSRNIDASGTVTDAPSTDGSKHDFLESAGTFFTSKPVRDDARTWTESTMKNRLVMPTYLPPQQQVVIERGTIDHGAVKVDQKPGVMADLREKLHDAKETVEDKLESAKDKIEDKLESAKEKIEDKLESAKDTIEDKLESAKDTVLGWKDDAVDKSRDLKHTIVDKKDEFVTTLKQKKDDVEEDLERGKRRVERKGQEIKDDIASQKDRAVAKAREWKADAKDELRETKDEVKDRVAKLKDRTVDAAHDVKADAKNLAEKAKSSAKSWWNPFSYFTEAEITERRMEVDSSPEGVHLRPIKDDVSQRDVDRRVETTIRTPVINPTHVPSSLRGLEGGVDLPAPSMPSMQLKGSPVEPIHVPTSLRGLEGGTKLPPPKMELPSMPSVKLHSSTGAKASDPVYVPNSLRGLEGGTDLPKASVPSDFSSSASGDIDSILVPLSLRGLESTNMPSRDLKPDISQPLRAKRPEEGHGFLYRLMHAFRRDSPETRRRDFEHVSGQPTRADKLNASARDFWDLRAQDVTPAKTYSAQVSPQESLVKTMKGESSAMPMDRLDTPSTVGFRGRFVDSDILHDRVWKEQLVETME